MSYSSFQSMDFIGRALVASLEKGGELHFLSAAGDREPYDFSRYKEDAEFSPLEQVALGSLRGDVLDIGCGTGSYYRHITQASSVTGLEISPAVVRYMRTKGRTCLNGDVFTMQPAIQYDSVLLLDNNIGLAATEDGLYVLLHRIHNLLRPGGSVIAHCRKGAPGIHTEQSQAVWGEEKSDWFYWLTTDVPNLLRISGEMRFSHTLLAEDASYFVSRLTRGSASHASFPAEAMVSKALQIQGLTSYAGPHENVMALSPFSYVIDDYLKIKPDSFGDRVRFPQPPDMVVFREGVQFGTGISAGPRPKCTLLSEGPVEHYWLRGEQMKQAWTSPPRYREFHPTIANLFSGSPAL